MTILYFYEPDKVYILVDESHVGHSENIVRGFKSPIDAHAIMRYLNDKIKGDWSKEKNVEPLLHILESIKFSDVYYGKEMWTQDFYREFDTYLKNITGKSISGLCPYCDYHKYKNEWKMITEEMVQGILRTIMYKMKSWNEKIIKLSKGIINISKPILSEVDEVWFYKHLPGRLRICGNGTYDQKKEDEFLLCLGEVEELIESGLK